MVLIVRTQDSKFCFLWNGDIKGSVMLTGGAAAGLRVFQLHSDQPGALVPCLDDGLLINS